MKKFGLIISALALVLGISQCKKPNMPGTNGGNGATQHVVLKASFDNGNSKIDQNGTGLKWTKDTDKIIVIKDEMQIGELTCKNVDGTFEGNITPVEGNIIFKYGAPQTDFTNQSGLLKDAVYLESPETPYSSEGGYVVTMTMPDQAVLKLDLKALGTATPGNTVTITKVVSGETVTVASVKDVTDEENNPYYVAVPATGTDVEYTFSGNELTAKTTWKIEANKFYTKEDPSTHQATGEAIVIEPPFPTVATIPVCAIHSTCASSGGVVTGAGVDEQGVCWGTSENPTIADNKYVHNYEYATNSFTPKTKSDNTFTGFMNGLSANTKYHVRAYIRKGNQVVYGDDIEFTTKTTAEDEVTFVDLGLSVKWATCNLGAANEYDYGDYYQWGDNAACSTISSGTTYYVDCRWSSYRYAANSTQTFTKYCPENMTDYWYSGAGSPDNKLKLELTDDCVRQTLGGEWRMPTIGEWQELYDNTTRAWTTVGGVGGWRFTSTKTGYTDKSIFLPAAGYRNGTSLIDTGLYGLYFSSSLYPYVIDSYGPHYAYYFRFNQDKVFPEMMIRRYDGLPVRPVK